jgi:DNA-binding transcriptional ArsR family regulator
MVNQQALPLDALFGALADPTRRAIVRRLAGGEASMSELAVPFAMTLPAISKHLGVLRRAGLVNDRKDGRVRHFGLRGEQLAEIDRWLADYRVFWEHQLDSLAAHLAQHEP